MTPEQQAERRKNYDAVLETYKKLGAKLEPIELNDIMPQMANLTNTLGFILDAESAASFDALTRSGDVDLLRRVFAEAERAGRGGAPGLHATRGSKVRNLDLMVGCQRRGRQTHADDHSRKTRGRGPHE